MGIRSIAAFFRRATRCEPARGAAHFFRPCLLKLVRAQIAIFGIFLAISHIEATHARTVIEIVILVLSVAHVALQLTETREAVHSCWEDLVEEPGRFLCQVWSCTIVFYVHAFILLQAFQQT